MSAVACTLEEWCNRVDASSCLRDAFLRDTVVRDTVRRIHAAAASNGDTHHEDGSQVGSRDDSCKDGSQAGNQAGNQVGNRGPELDAQGVLDALPSCAQRGDAIAVHYILTQCAPAYASSAAGDFLAAFEDARDEALVFAATNGHADVVRLLVEGGGGADACIRGLFASPLHAAAHGGHCAVMGFLIEKKADPHRSVGGFFLTPLAVAVTQGHAHAVVLLCKAKAGVGAEDNWGFRCLTHAASFGDAATTVALIRFKALVDPDDECRDCTPLGAAACSDSLAATRALLKAKAQVNRASANVFPVDLAATRGSARQVCLLLRAGADAQRVSNEGKMSSLVYAAAAGTWFSKYLPPNTKKKSRCERIGVMTALLEAKANVNGEVAAAMKPLVVAAFFGFDEEVTFLLRAGADVNLASHVKMESGHWCWLTQWGQSANVETPLGAAARSGKASTVALLLEAQADVDACTELGTALTLAAGRGSDESVALLLRARASANKLTRAGMTGMTPLMAAACCLYFGDDTSAQCRAVSLLLEHKAEADMTALSLASYWHRTAVVAELVTHRTAVVGEAAAPGCRQTQLQNLLRSSLERCDCGRESRYRRFVVPCSNKLATVKVLAAAKAALDWRDKLWGELKNCTAAGADVKAFLLRAQFASSVPHGLTHARLDPGATSGR